MRTDPSENGGLFVGRRPGTAPVRFRALPERGSATRQRIDGWFAVGMQATIVFLSLLCWGPIPIACTWVGSRVTYVTGSISLGLVASVLVLGALLFGALSLMRRLDGAWVLVRRAAGHDQRKGTLGKVFAITAVVCGTAFGLWWTLIHGSVSQNMFRIGP